MLETPSLPSRGCLQGLLTAAGSLGPSEGAPGGRSAAQASSSERETWVLEVCRVEEKQLPSLEFEALN